MEKTAQRAAEESSIASAAVFDATEQQHQDLLREAQVVPGLVLLPLLDC